MGFTVPLSVAPVAVTEVAATVLTRGAVLETVTLALAVGVPVVLAVIVLVLVPVPVEYTVRSAVRVVLALRGLAAVAAVQVTVPAEFVQVSGEVTAQLTNARPAVVRLSVTTTLVCVEPVNGFCAYKVNVKLVLVLTVPVLATLVSPT